MGIFPTLIEKRKAGTRGELDDFWYNAISPETRAGTQVSEKTALKYLTVFACVSLIAADLARLPLILYRRLSDNSKKREMDHPLYDILHNVTNPEMTSFQWREAGEGHCLLWGNHYSIIERSGLSRTIKALWPLDNPGGVEVKRNRNDKIIYKWRDNKNNENIMPKEKIFHVPGFGFNGIKGMSMIALAREAIGVGLAAEEFGARFFGDGMHLGGTITLDRDLGDAEKDYKAALKKEYAGLGKSHGVLLLQNGEVYTPFKMPLEDAQYLETRNHQKIEICGMYHVPPHKIAIHGQNSNYNNLEQENASYVDSCLMHWLIRWEQCISHQLLTAEERRAGLFVEFLVEGLLRGDSQARSEYYNKIFQIGAITPNEIRAKENMNPIDGGDSSFVQLNLIPLDQAGEMPASGDQSAGRSNLPMLENRSIHARDRITQQYYPLFLRASERIVDLEANAVKNKIKKFRKQRQKVEMEKWLNEFYNNLPEKIKREIGPVFQSFSEAIINESAAEIGIEPGKIELKQFVTDYIETYSKRHASSSIGQLTALLRDEAAELDALEERVDEWSETRPEKIARNETTRAGNGIFQAVAFSVGLSTVWRIRGAKTCPYCRSLNGKRVRNGESFAKDGSELNPKDGNGPMKIKGMKAHPPLHQACDCWLSIG